MSKRLTTILTGAIAGGTLLLAGCGQTAPQTPAGAAASSTTAAVTTTTVATTTTAPAAGGGGVEPVSCGEIKVPGGAVHKLIADSAADGRVGCTEAFNVMGEFEKLPQGKRAEASLGNVTLPSGWSCTVDEGKTAAIFCVKTKAGATKFGLSLHTEPVKR